MASRRGFASSQVSSPEDTCPCHLGVHLVDLLLFWVILLRLHLGDLDVLSWKLLISS